MKTAQIGFIVFAAGIQAACAIPPLYWGEAIEMQLIDKDTKEPIEDAVAVAYWELKGGIEGGNVVGQQMILEAVSDTNGRLSFPAWGPEPNHGGRLRGATILAFKPGYSYSIFGQPPGITFKDGPTLISYWDGKVAEMKRFEGRLEDYKGNIGRITTPLDHITRDCGWKNIPHMVVALTKQSDVFRQNNIVSGLTYTMYGYFHSNNDKLRIDCGVAPLELFGRYMQ